MKITFDDQIFTFQRRGGVSRYFVELLRQFQQDPALDVEAITPFRYVLNDHLLAFGPERFRRAPLPAAAQRARVLRPLNRMTARRSAPPALLHHTYSLHGALAAPARTRVCTVYDMTPELFPEHFPFGNPHQAKREFVEACDAVLCISQTTKDDLIKIYGDLDKPVVVTPLGVGDEFFVDPPELEATPDYVLYVGHRVGYKNFDVVLRAFALLKAERPGLSLVCVGAPFTESETARLAELGLTDQVRQREAGDDELPALFARALCFVFPSRYEGFGLPIVEAFAAGCPVLLADMPCSVEVGGEAAQFFAPDDHDRLAALIEEMVATPQSRKPWVDAGRVRARQFTWRRTAELTRDLYAELLA
ncbi:MAG TPA: glycosyltransferase family 1 protein [Acidimicrobiales bacterium]|jgi:glycosyltransferase involved in cell wall biosynthesis|nr:glycosyltransferase family 1 protein [Acidimicrobiales bacterium]